MVVAVPPGFWDFIMYVSEQAKAEEESSSKSAARSTARSRRGFTAAQILSVAPKKKRKVSRYQKEFGRQLKKLIKAHPRTPRTRLMKRAHTATKKALK